MRVSQAVAKLDKAIDNAQADILAASMRRDALIEARKMMVMRPKAKVEGNSKKKKENKDAVR